MSYRPLARSTDLVVESLGEELLIFDSVRQRAHSLNTAAAAVFRAADGTRTVDELAIHVGLDDDATLLAIADLERCHLLAGPAPAPGINRRAALRKAALTGAGIGVAIPVIRSITAPTAALAASGCIQPGHQGCTSPRTAQVQQVQNGCCSNALCSDGRCCFGSDEGPCTSANQCCGNLFCNTNSNLCQPPD